MILIWGKRKKKTGKQLQHKEFCNAVLWSFRDTRNNFKKKSINIFRHDSDEIIQFKSTLTPACYCNRLNCLAYFSIFLSFDSISRKYCPAPPTQIMPLVWSEARPHHLQNKGLPPNSVSKAPSGIFYEGDIYGVFGKVGGVLLKDQNNIEQ